MKQHDEIWELLPLAAAGALDSGFERDLRGHVDECQRCADELAALQELTGELGRLPTPQPSDRVVDSVRRRVHLELAALSDDRLSEALVAFLLIFSWTVTLTGYLVFRLLSGEPLALWSALSTAGIGWSAAYFVVAWSGGAAAVVLLGLNYRRDNVRRLA